MRIALVNNGADLYGASRCLLRLASRLVRDGHAVRVVLPFDGPLVQALATASVDVRLEPTLPLLARSRFRDLRGIASLLAAIPGARRKLVQSFREFEPDVVHTNTTTTLLSSALAARDVGVPHIWHMREFYRDFPRLWPFYRILLCHSAARIVCVSHAVASEFSPHQRQRLVRVVYDGFPREEFQPVPAARVKAVREHWGVGDAPTVGVIGRIKLHRKGQDTFVEAAARLGARFPSARFVIVGSPYPGNESHGVELAARIRKLNLETKVSMPGDATDIQAAHAALDVLVLASGMPEPFGNVVVEAMGFGRPVVGTRIGGTPEQIEDGVTGLLIPPEDPHAMADAIGRLLADRELATRMGAEGRRRFEDHFEFEPYYRQMLSVYDDVVQGWTRSGAGVARPSVSVVGEVGTRVQAE